MFHVFMQVYVKGSEMSCFEKYVHERKFSEFYLTNLKRTIVQKYVCIGKIWCFYLRRRSYNLNNFYFYIIILRLTLLLHFYQLFMPNLILVCWLVFIVAILKAVNLMTTVVYQTDDIHSYQLSQSLIGK